MASRKFPTSAAWRHVTARDGFEVVFLDTDGGGYRFEGYTSAVEAGETWAVEYVVALSADWRTRSARVRGRSKTGARDVLLEADGKGHWRIDGTAAPHLEGCLDVDLESSSLTNAFPIHRLALRVGDAADAPAAYVRALDLSVERLEQRYGRVANDGERERYDYSAPAFGVACRVVYDESGLVLDYPGIAVRVV